MIRLGPMGRKILVTTAWVLGAGALAGAVGGLWIEAIELGVLALACTGVIRMSPEE